MDKRRKLHLAKETLRSLALKEMADVGGGASNQVKCRTDGCGTDSCTCASGANICCA